MIHKLKNGLRLIAIPMSGTKTATILVIVGTGSKYENKNNNGISHFLEHMFFKGTAKRPSTMAISAELDGIGAEFNAFTAKEYTGYWVKSDASKIELAMDVVSDMLLNSKIDAGEIAREKGVIIEEFNMYRDNPMMYVEDLFEECLYGDQPAGWDTIGTKQSILGLSRPDFMDYLKSQYGAQNTVICLAGNINNNIIKKINKYFSKYQPTDFKDKIKVKEAQSRTQCKVHYKKTDQAHLSLGVRAFPIGHRDEIALKILGVLLGGSMSSRLFINLRERQGLAYYIRTSTEFYTDSGYLTTQAGVPVDKLEKAIQIILQEYKEIKIGLADKDELRRVKDLFAGKLAIQLEASDNVADWYGRQAVIRKNIFSPEEYIKKIKSVKLTDLRRVAQDIFTNQGLNLAVIGPYRDEARFRKILKI